MSQFIGMFYGMETTPVKDYIDDSFPGEWGTEDKDGNGVKVIRTTNFTNSGKLNLADVVTRSIEDRKVARKQIKKYDTILERSGGTADNPVGRVVLFEEDDLFLCNNFTQVLRFKDVDPRFTFYALYYFYQTNRTAIRSMGSKTTGIQNLNMSKYLEIGIPNASDEDQKVFVAIAEQADKSEFIGCKSQFIEMFSSVPKVDINCMVDTIWGSSPDSKTYNDNGEGVPFYQGKTEFGDIYINEASTFCTAPIRMAKQHAILMSVRAPVGAVNIATQDCCIGRGLASITPKVGKSITMFVFYALKYMEDEIERLGTGSTFKAINKDSYARIQMPDVDIEKQIEFVKIAEQADKSEYYN